MLPQIFFYKYRSFGYDMEPSKHIVIFYQRLEQNSLISTWNKYEILIGAELRIVKTLANAAVYTQINEVSNIIYFYIHFFRKETGEIRKALAVFFYYAEINNTHIFLILQHFILISKEFFKNRFFLYIYIYVWKCWILNINTLCNIWSIELRYYLCH